MILPLGFLGMAVALFALKVGEPQTKFKMSPCPSLTDYVEGGLCAGGESSKRPADPLPVPTWPTRPNIVLIVTDDQRFDTLWVMPSVQLELVSKGIKFDNAFVSTPLCCPSRSSILKGQHSHKTNCFNNGVCLNNYDPLAALNTWLYDAGYRTGLFGKYLNTYGQDEGNSFPPKWSRWVAFAPSPNSPVPADGYLSYRVNVDGEIVYPEEYATDYLADELIDFISTTSEQPFFAYFTPYAPHVPALPSPEDVCDLESAPNSLPCQIESMPDWRPPSYNEEDVGDKPLWIKEKSLIGSERAVISDDFHKRQLMTLLPLDRAINRIVTTLYHNNKLSNTVIIFTSDNGLAWGEHRLVDSKPCPYDECLRVPLIFRIPGIPPRLDSHNLVENIDLAPTILDLAGVPLPPEANFDGLSLKPVFLSQDFKLRDEIYFETLLTEGESWIGDFHALRNDNWMYINYPVTGEEELYNLDNDPYQLNNSIGNKIQSAQAAALKSHLLEIVADQALSKDSNTKSYGRKEIDRMLAED